MAPSSERYLSVVAKQLIDPESYKIGLSLRSLATYLRMKLLYLAFLWYQVVYLS
jgi:hypothetical protein